MQSHSFIKLLEQEIADLEAELEHIPTYVKLREARRLLGVYRSGAASQASPRNASTAKAPSSRRPFTSGASAEILAAVREILTGRVQPTSTREILEMIRRRGIHIKGAVPQNVVSSLLSKSPEFQSHGRSGWTLLDEETGDAAASEPASPASWQLHSSSVEPEREAAHDNSLDER